ncbi:hypothetical protein G3H63_13135 [Microbacterium resistens]|uniref:alanine racemase n=1 Tax=Microbacterium resistens TaxID=156977 RepID=UPI001C5880B3|nr:alanine racemase [Microbacterium resistens]MBW1640009.1 hypothetical protein [Microbacterium resistens]
MTDWSAVAARAAEGGVRTPMMVVDAAAVWRNVARAAGAIAEAGWEWRAHVKTARTEWAIRMLVAYGVTRVKAATIGEADAAARAGAVDVLLALPAVGPLVRDLAEVARRHPGTRFSALVDDPLALGDWSEAGELAAMIDVDTGMHRTGIDVGDVDRVVSLAAALARKGVPFAGLHTYDGHLAAREVAERRDQVEWQAERIDVLVAAMEGAGHGVPEIVLGATHTLDEHLATHRARPGGPVLSAGAGTLVYGDARSAERFVADGNAPYEPAAAVLTRVVSRGSGRATVDAGATAVQTDAGAPHAVVVHPAGLRPYPPSQEHLVLHGEAPPLGAVVVLVPRHVDTALSQFSAVAVLHEDGRVTHETVVGRH